MAPALSAGIGSLLHLDVLKAHAGPTPLFYMISVASVGVITLSVARLIVLHREEARERERLFQRQRETQLLGVAARRVWGQD